MRKIIDLLAIILPAIIIILGFVRLFVQKTKGVNGLTMLCAILLLLTGLLRYFIIGSGGGGSRNNDPKPTPLTVSKHSEAFNISFEKVLTAYYNLSTGFINNDTAIVNKGGIELRAALDSFKVNELSADSLIYQTALQPYENAKAEAASIIADPSMQEKRGSFNILSNELFSLLSTARYDLGKVYWQECDKAFGEDKPGNWISKGEKSENPYGQKDCADIKTTLDFTPADTTKKQ